ncbi:1,4-dihydroxy-2-naphthoate octaprenyltransferase [Stomatohabitans albus]|uniref:1,4-dihydroxy-2-naphthoate octaprenyltransferase n=1 Tax=Stomatohabitans albus TaxID=3110766 RepID=UPI00300D37C4
MNPYVEAARPKTLFNALAPVVMGTGAGIAGSVEYAETLQANGHEPLAAHPVSLISFVLLALVVATSATVAVNYANDLFDGVAGNDSPDRTGPRRAVAAGLVTPQAMTRALMIAMAVFIGSGLALIVLAQAWVLLPIGIICCLLLYAYSGGPYPLASHALGEVAVFLTFGLAATMGTAYGLNGLPWYGLAYAIGIGGFSCAVLEANNIRDIPEDSANGKHTLAVRLGDKQARNVYTGLVLLPYLVTIWKCVELAGKSINHPGMYAAFLPACALLSFPLAYRGIARVRSGASGQALIPVLASTGLAMTVWALLMAVTITLSAILLSPQF